MSTPLPDAEGMRAMRAWVGWLVRTYEIDEWPTCWENHDGLITDLQALQRWWEWASSESARQSEWSMWMDGVARFRERVRETARRCDGDCMTRRDGATTREPGDMATGRPLELVGTPVIRDG